ncbi:MAG: DUF167 domain-containing protein [Patescibacteria group bacterium]
MTKKITTKVIPRSSRNEIVGELADGTLKVKLTAAPIDGAANEALITFLSKEWSIPRSSMSIIKGQRSKRKVIEIK